MSAACGCHGLGTGGEFHQNGFSAAASACTDAWFGDLRRLRTCRRERRDGRGATKHDQFGFWTRVWDFPLERPRVSLLRSAQAAVPPAPAVARRLKAK